MPAGENKDNTGYFLQKDLNVYFLHLHSVRIEFGISVQIYFCISITNQANFLITLCRPTQTMHGA